jgi:hypothetical protein
MLSYLEFLLENKLTLRLFFSHELRVILSNIIKSDQPGWEVAKYLLNCHSNRDNRYEMTFVDKTNKNDRVSFLQVNRAKRFFDESGDENIENWAFNQMYNQNLGRPSKVWKEQRSEISIGKFTNKIYQNDKKTLTSKELENFVNLYKSFYDMEKEAFSRFEVVSGEEIKKWYLYENYEDQRGQLGASCMRHKGCQNYFNIYTQNPEVVSLVILKSSKDDTKITGRALLWTSTLGNKIMDRIYYINDSDRHLFEKFAKENGWKSKDDMNWRELEENTIQLKKWNFDEYPYLDTYAYLSKEKGVLSADEDLWPEQGYIRLQSTSGLFEDDDVVWDDYSGEYIPRDEAAYCDRRGEWVHENDATWLEYREEYAHPYDELCYSRYEDENYFSDDCVFSDILGDYYLTENTIEIIVDKNISYDFIHSDFEDSLVGIKIDGDTYKTLDLLTMVNPITGIREFKEKVLTDIKNEYEIVSDEKLENYIRNLDIDLDENNLDIILSYLNDYFLKSQYRRNPNELKKLIKLSLITSPIKSDRGIISNIIENLKGDEIYKELDEDLQKRISGFLTSSFSLNLLKLSESLLVKILKDPQMLVSYMVKKGLTYADWRKLIV